MKRKAISIEEKNQRTQLNTKESLRFLRQSADHSFHPHVMINGDGRCLNLQNMTLCGYVLIGCDFSGADLSGTDFSGANLSGVIFNECRLENSRFDGCILDQVIFKNCDLSHAFFKKNDLKNTRFYQSTLTQASFDKIPNFDLLPISRKIRVAQYIYDICSWDYAPPNSECMIFLHGFGGLKSDFLDLANHFKDQYQMHAIALTGHAQTSYSEYAQYEDPENNGNVDLHEYKPQREQGFLKEVDLLAKAIIQILDQSDQKSLILVGYSLGGRLSLHLSLHPLLSQRIKAMILMGATPGLKSAELKEQRWYDDLHWINFLIQDDDLGQFFKKWYTQEILVGLSQKRPKFFKERTLQQIDDHHPMGLIFALYVFSLANMPSVWDQLAHIQIPTLWLNGEGDRKFCDIAKEAVLLMPFADMREVKSASHQAFLEEPSLCIEHISAFLSIAIHQ